MSNITKIIYWFCIFISIPNLIISFDNKSYYFFSAYLCICIYVIFKLINFKLIINIKFDDKN